MALSTSWRWIAPCALALTLAACASPPRTADGRDPRFQPAAASDVLAQTSWDLARWTRPGGALRSIPHPSSGSRPLTIGFIHDQGATRATGFAGCNTYSAPYTVANGQLIIQSTRWRR